MPPVIEKNGKKMYRHKKLLFGAKGGMILIFDERDGTTSTCKLTEFAARAEALGLEAARCVYGTERSELENAANDMEACCADAAHQGDPTDPEVQAYHARHKKQGLRLVGAGTVNFGGKSKLPPPPKALLRGGVILPGLSKLSN